MPRVVYEAEPIFPNRSEAGKLVSERLSYYQGSEAVVFAIPRGGLPVAIEVAHKLALPLDIVIPRKITIPYNPEAGYGAVTEDGTIVLNEPLVRQLELAEWQIKQQAEKVQAEIARRSTAYRSTLPVSSVAGKTAIIVDDGLASGYTMVAAVKSLQQRQAAKIVVAVPVASGTAYDLVRPMVDSLVCLVIARVHWFAVASFYTYWHDLTDEEVIKYLSDWQARHRQR